MLLRGAESGGDAFLHRMPHMLVGDLLRRLGGAAETVLENIERGVFHVPFQLSQSAAPVRGLLRKYRDVPADFADACLIHLADQLNTGDILTLDRDFESYRWRRTRPFRLLVNVDLER